VVRWLWWVAQSVDLAPGQDEVGLIGVVITEPDHTFTGVVDQPGGGVDLDPSEVAAAR
jgi:hypothetical protein